ncbi:ABC transporter ATP-binding protein [Parenemella sanctibonifatiensis]|nr:ABC transporter ATP-binding protein [Parenemella sanctibonifatiensis]
MGMGGGGMMMGPMGSFRKDRSVKDSKLQPGTWRRVLGFAQPYRASLTVFVIAIAAEVVAGIVPPLLFQRIIDDGVLAGNRQAVITLTLVLVGVALLGAGATLVKSWFSARIGEGLIRDMRVAVFDRVLQMPLAFFTRSHTGKLVTRINSDVNGAQQAFTQTLSVALSTVLSLVLVLVAMVSLSWQLTLGALVLAPILWLASGYASRRLPGITRDRMQANGDLGATMTERFSVSGALLVKLFGRTADERRHFRGQAAKLADLGVQFSLTQRFFLTAMVFVAALATAIIYGFGGVMAIDGGLTVGALTALAVLVGRLFQPLVTMVNLRVEIMSALVSFERVFEVLDLPIPIHDKPDAVEVRGPARIEFDDVTFQYPDATGLPSLEVHPEVESNDGEPVLRSVTWRAEPGQTVALVGPSGSGKTTMTHLIARLYDVDAGSVRVGDVDVRDLQLESLHAYVGYVTQDAHMFHETVRYNLDYAKPGASDEEMYAALASARLDDLVRRLPDGLDTVVGDRGYRLSGGERQRLAIARLLLKAPPIVVLDEATAHLDSDSERAVQEALDLAMEGRTSIVIAHRLSTVRQADQILVVKDGEIVERGRHDDLLAADGVYATLHRTQFALHE